MQEFTTQCKIAQKLRRSPVSLKIPQPGWWHNCAVQVVRDVKVGRFRKANIGESRDSGNPFHEIGNRYRVWTLEPAETADGRAGEYFKKGDDVTPVFARDRGPQRKLFDMITIHEQPGKR